MPTTAPTAPSTDRHDANAAAEAAVAAGRTPHEGGEEHLKLSHAYLELFEPSKDGSLDKPGPQLGQIEFQFNPKELTMGKAASWARQTAKANKQAGPPQYLGALPSKLTIEMFFDASGKQDDSVEKRVKKLFDCCAPTPGSAAAGKGSPPWVMFRWGEHTQFHAYVASVQAKYTLFTAAGVPVRANCTVALEEIAGDPPKQNPTSGGLLPRRVHDLIDGDTLAGIAYSEYGNASLWRAVAAVNGIDDPMRVRPGTAVFLPSVAELPAPSTARVDSTGLEVPRGLR